MPFQIIRNDITKVKADIIVNTANPLPMIGRGTDSAVYAAAGVDKLLAERAKIGNIERGQAAVTPAFNLSAKYIIHTVGPSWEGGSHGERDILHSCYENSLTLAADLKAESIAFPLIATGVYGFPKDEALNIALSEIGKFLLTHDMKVILVVFDKGSFELSGQVISRIDEFIDEHGVGLVKKKEYGDSAYLDRRRLMIEEERRRYHFSSLSQAKPEKKEEVIYGSRPEPLGVTFADMGGKSLDEIVGDAGDTFQQRLFKLRIHR